MSSSSMEGTYTTLTDLFLFEAGAVEATTRGDSREVLNYVRALEGAIDNGTLPQPLLYMSPCLERHKDRYIDLMYAVSQRGAWEEWVAFLLEAVAESASETITVVERLQNLQQAYRARSRRHGDRR